MAPRTIYANLADGLQPFSLWDQSLADMASLGIIPCTAVGANAIVLTPIASVHAPNVSTPQALQAFSFVAAGNSTGPVTVNIGTLTGTLFRVDGVTPATSGDLAINVFYLIAVNNAGTGFQILAPVANQSIPVGNITGLGTGIAAALAIAKNGVGGLVGVSGALGTPTSGILTNATGLPFSTGMTGQASLAQLPSIGAYTALANSTGSAAVPIATQIGFLHAKDFGAVGDNSTDDTTALRNWITACQNSNSVGFLDAGTYKITSALTVTGALTIIGAGQDAARIVQNGDVDGIAITTPSPVNFSNFQMFGVSTTAGALISITATGDQNIASVISHMTFTQGWNAINFISAGGWKVDGVFISGANNAGIIAANTHNTDGGDQIITNSNLVGQNNGSGVGILQNSAGGLRIVGNKIAAFGVGYKLSLASGVQTSELTITGNNFENNTDIQFTKGSGTAFGNVSITGNYFTIEAASGGFGITDDSNASWFNGLTISGNVFNIVSGTSTAISLANTGLFSIVGNLIEGNGSTPTGISIGSGSTKGVIDGNIIDSVHIPTRISNSSTTTIVTNNVGYNPVGVTAAANVGTSPATITAGASPETHYVRQSATNTATIAKGGQQVATLAGASTYYTIELGPFESYVVTWTVTQPTFTKDVH